MSFSVKRAKGNSNDKVEIDRTNRSEPVDPLFETEWDELVILFDQESHRYRVRTASQDIDRIVAKRID